MDLIRNSQDDDDDDGNEGSNVKMRTGMILCIFFAIMCI